jgi:ribosome-binding factor A
MAKREQPLRRGLLAARAEVGPEDGTDPREWAKAESRRPPGRKALQLCRQVADALNAALAGCRDEVLSGLVVMAVTPAPNAGRLRVTVAAAPSAAVRDAAAVTEHLHRAAGRLRAEVAAAIHRRKTPELTYEVVARPTYWAPAP